MKKVMQTLSITSGKGGVGKTTLTANLAAYWAQMGKKVLLFDGDVGMANLDIFFGFKASRSILDVIEEKAGIQDILLHVLPGVDLIPGGTGLIEFNKMTAFEKRALLSVIEDVGGPYDIFMIDTAPGISDQVLYLNAATEERWVVLTPDPASFTDSYALIKVLNQHHRIDHFSIICNGVKDFSSGFELFKKFNNVVAEYLNVSLDYLGAVPFDHLVRKTSMQQKLMVYENPDTFVSKAIGDIADRAKVPSQKSESIFSLFWDQGARAI